LNSDTYSDETKLEKIIEFHKINLETIAKVSVQDKLKIKYAMDSAVRKYKKE
tara:strand:- start:605 stop:760 length:156 start_codon:yes stop_codon:yes gene_type:complete